MARLPVALRQRLPAFTDSAANRGDSILLPCAASKLRLLLRGPLPCLIPNQCVLHEPDHYSR